MDKIDYIRKDFLYQKLNPNIDVKYTRYKNEFNEFGVKIFKLKNNTFQITAGSGIVGTYVNIITAKVIYIMFIDYIVLANDNWNKEIALLCGGLEFEDNLNNKEI